jgi:hypothetical protein
MPQLQGKGQPISTTQPKLTAFTQPPPNSAQNRSSPSVKAAQSAATARWLDEEPRQGYWNPVACMNISNKAASKV